MGICLEFCLGKFHLSRRALFGAEITFVKRNFVCFLRKHKETKVEL